MFAYLICLKYLLPSNTEKRKLDLYVVVCAGVLMYMHTSKFPAVNVQEKLYMKTMRKDQHCMLLIN